MVSPREDLDVVVVGAGLAGLAAARALVAAGAGTLVVEARERVGGRTLNEDIGDGRVVEIGGQWIGPTQDRLYELAGELQIGTFPTFTDGDNLLELNGKLRRYRGAIPRLNPISLLEVERTRRRLDSMARRVPLNAPWEAPKARALDGRTLASFLDRMLRTGAARRLVEIAARTIWGADSADISLLYALWYLHAAGGFNPLIEVEGGAQEERFIGGSQLIALAMAGELGPRVRLGQPVRRIAQRDGGVAVEAGEMRVEARRAIVAIAPQLCQRISFEPGLPPAREQLCQRMPWGSYLKCTAIYDEPFWRADGLNGEGVSDAGPATTTFDNTPPEGSPGVLMSFVSGSEARAMQRLGEAERRDAILAGLGRLYGPRALRPERWIEQDWAREPYTGGGPVCFMPPGVQASFGAAIREPVGAIHWAGTETAGVWSGYMDGAVRSGDRAAAEALAAL